MWSTVINKVTCNLYTLDFSNYNIEEKEEIIDLQYWRKLFDYEIYILINIFHDTKWAIYKNNIVSIYSYFYKKKEYKIMRKKTNFYLWNVTNNISKLLGYI